MEEEKTNHKNEIPEPSTDFADFDYWDYCVNCGTRMYGWKCKWICPKCGYYHNCSEP